MPSQPNPTTKMNRRQFLQLAVVAGIAVRQTLSAGGIPTGPTRERVVNAGPVSNYDTDGQYDRFLDQGFFVIRKGQALFALSSECTHRQCKLKVVRSQGSFDCPCHGSRFDSSGKVIEGPAKRNLSVFPSVVNENGQLLVTVPILEG